MDLSNQVDKLFLEKQDYCHWAKLLTFFDKHRRELDNKDKKRIFLRIEKYRTEHNTRHPTDIIRREDIKPDIYTSLTSLEEKTKANEVPVPTDVVYT